MAQTAGVAPRMKADAFREEPGRNPIPMAQLLRHENALHT
jgi:hypothetical protein